MLVRYSDNRFATSLPTTRTLLEIHTEITQSTDLKRLVAEYNAIRDGGYSKSLLSDVKAKTSYFYTQDSEAREAVAINKLYPLVVLDVDKIEPENVNLVRSKLCMLKPNLLYKTASGLGFRVVFNLDFPILPTDLANVHLAFKAELYTADIARYIDSGAKALGKAWGLWYDPEAVYCEQLSPTINSIRNHLNQKELMQILDRCLASLMAKGLEGNRHQWRYNTAMLLGGLCARHAIPHGLAMSLFIPISDSISGEGVTSDSEIDTIRSAFNLGLARPIHFNNEVLIDGDMSFLDHIKDFDSSYPDFTFKLNNKQELIDCQQNMVYTLSRADSNGLYFYRDIHTGTYYCNGKAIDFTNMAKFDRFLPFPAKNDKDVPRAIRLIASYNTYSSAVNYFESLDWDGIERINSLYQKMPLDFNFENAEEYYSKIFEFMLLGLVLRSYRPGHKFDYGFFLVGAKGVGKTRFIESINPVYQNSKPFVPTTWRELTKTNDAKAATLGSHILYIEENIGLERLGTAEIKGILSKQIESGRKMYSDVNEDIKRTSIIIADSNNINFIEDASTNRKMLPVIFVKQVSNYINQVRIDCDYIKANIDQLYAEVIYKHRGGVIKDIETGSHDSYAEIAIGMESLSGGAIGYCAVESPFVYGFKNVIENMELRNIHLEFVHYYVNNTPGIFHRNHRDAIQGIIDWLRRSAYYSYSESTVMSSKSIKSRSTSYESIVYSSYRGFRASKPGFIYTDIFS